MGVKAGGALSLSLSHRLLYIMYWQNFRPLHTHRNTDALAQLANHALLDPADFRFAHIADETLVKVTGEVRGQQFLIENCIVCSFLLAYAL